VQVRKLFFQGLAAYEDGKPDEATGTWRKLLNLYGRPRKMKGWMNLPKLACA
jgi:cytochrome c-type biogenesis protein CcmH/NrfG